MLTLRAALIAVVVLGIGCTNDVCDPHVANQTVVKRAPGDPEVDACVTKNQCAPLCADVFQVDPSVISECRIYDIDAANNVTVRVLISDPERCVAGGDDVYADWDDDWDGWYPDDSCDDSSCDGSTDDGSDDGSTDDGSDDGSTDDGDDSGDDGGDDGDDDARPVVPHHHHAPAAGAQSYTLAPQR